MWPQTVLILFLIKSSLEMCDKIERIDYRYYYRYYSYNDPPKRYSSISCSNLTVSSIHKEIMDEMDTNVEKITIFNSNIPELSQDMFSNINVKGPLEMQAGVEIIQSKTFENCNVSSINLDNNDIKMIKDKSFSSLFITSLSLQNNSLSEIKVNNFLGLTNLEKLNLKNNRIIDIEGDSFNSLTNVEELDLSSNRLRQLHSGLFKSMTHLRNLYLNDNLLKELKDDMFTQCKYLSRLNIADNNITAIDAKLYPKSLSFMNISNNQISSASFLNLDYLQTIDLSYNNLTHLPMLHTLPSLGYLSLNHNPLGPSINATALNNLDRLRSIDLEDIGVQKFDFKLLTNLKTLRELSLAVNNLTTLDFPTLDARLVTLNLSRNGLNEVDNLSKLEYLVTLDLSYNNLEEVEYNKFQNISMLHELFLQYNYIHTLHMGCFRDSKYLTTLNLSHNKITSIEIGAFSGVDNIEDLDISYNNLVHLDEHIFHNFKDVRNLNIAFNNLNGFEISKALSHITNQNSYYYSKRRVNLIGNNWTCESLFELTKMSSRIEVVGGEYYNVSNILGIPCNNTVIEQPSPSDDSSMNITTYLISVGDYVQSASSRIAVTNVVLILLLLLVCAKLAYKKCSSCFATEKIVATAKKITFGRYTSEQEVRLI